MKPDLLFTQRADLTRVPFPDDPYSVDLVLVWDEVGLRYQIQELSVRRNREFVTGAGVRSIAIHELMQQLFRSGVRSIVRLESGSPVIDPTEATGRQMAAELPDNEKLLWAARFYAIARAAGEAPLKTIAGIFRVSQSTATRMIARAREAGLVD